MVGQPAASPWTTERVARMIELLRAGHSCALIAKDLGAWCSYHDQITHMPGGQRDVDRIAARSMAGRSWLSKAVVMT